MSNIAYTSEPLDFLLTVDFDPGASVSTLIGATVRADAISDRGTKVTGSASVIDATKLRVTFAAGALSVGRYEVQVLVSPPGVAAQVVSSELWIVKPGAAA